jgi:hypothetical protein
MAASYRRSARVPLFALVEKWREVLLHASSHFNSQSMIGHNATPVARESSNQRSTQEKMFDL